MAQKAVRTITVTIGSKSLSGRLAESTVYKGGSVEVDHIASFDDPEFTTIPRPVKQPHAFKFTVIDDGTLEDLYDLNGTVAAVTIAVTYGDGKTDGSAVSKTRDMAIHDVAPGGDIAVDGDRKSTIVITATPHAPAASTQTTQTT